MAKLSIVRRALKAIGLSEENINDIITMIEDFLRGEKFKQEKLPYILNDKFLTPAEYSFFKVLNSVVEERAFISVKVGLGDIFRVKASDRSEYRIYRNKIDRKHVDFLLCDPITMKPIVGIELDDKSHQQKARKERDEFVDQVFASAELPIVHIPVKRGYSIADLEEHLMLFLPSPAIDDTAETPTTTIKDEEEVIEETETMTCPKCSSEMVLRTAKRGANAGNQFWGCSNYPSCKKILKYEPTQETQSR